MATDKRLDQVSQLTDFDYALIVKGDQVAKASKQQLAELVGNLLYGATNASSLATVVAGLLGNPLGFKGDKSGVDANNLTSSGMYYLGSNITNAMAWSFLIVFNFGNSGDVVQFNIHNGDGDAKYRKCSSGKWYSWVLF